MRRKELSTVGQRGFTLIELLVVIAVIALLAAILFPVFARARESARRTACLSNMKQINLGLMQYSQDYDERLPAYSTGSATISETAPPFYHNMIFPYVKSEQIFRCPSVKKLTGKVFADEEYPSYGLMGRQTCIGASVWFIYDKRGFPLSVAKEPARTWMATESQKAEDRMSIAGEGWHLLDMNLNLGTNLGTFSNSWNINHDVHFDGYNVAFLDGHVKWVKYGAENGYISSVAKQ